MLQGPGARWLFPAIGAEGHMPRQSLSRLLTLMAIEAGVAPSRVTPHVIRHAFATHLLEAAPICAASRCCWVTPTWERPRSIPMCWTSACAILC